MRNRSLPLVSVLLIWLALPLAAATAQEPPALTPGTPVDPLLPTAQKRKYVAYVVKIAEGTKSFRVTATSKDGREVRIFCRFGQEMPEWKDSPDHVADNVLYVDKNSQPALRAGTYFLDVAYGGDAPEGNTCRLLLELDVDPPPAVQLAVDGKLEANSKVGFNLPHPSGRTYLTYTFEVTDADTTVRFLAESEQDIDIYIRFGKQMEDYTTDAEYYRIRQDACDITIHRDQAQMPLRSGTYFIDITFNASAIARRATGTLVALTQQQRLSVDASLTPREPLEFSLPHPSGRVYQTFIVEAPANVQSLRITLVGDDGIDVYVRHGEQMANYETDADYSVVGQARRDIYVDRYHPDKPVKGGVYYIDVTFKQDENVKSVKGRIVVQLDEPPPVDDQVKPGQPYEFELESRGTGKHTTVFFDVPAGAKKVTITTTCRADIDLAVRRGHWLHRASEQSSSTNTGNESITIVPLEGETFEATRFYVVVVYSAARGTAKGKLDVKIER